MDSLADYMYAYYQRVVTGNASMSGAINVSRAAVGVEATTALTGSGTVAAPGAGVAVAAINGVATGTYEIEVTTFISGTTAAVDATNMQFRISGAAHATILNPVPAAAGATGLGTFRTRVNLSSVTSLSVHAIAAATAGSSYSATIVAQKIGF